VEDGDARERDPELYPEAAGSGPEVAGAGEPGGLALVLDSVAVNEWRRRKLARSENAGGAISE
jgi:hypothetical protein